MAQITISNPVFDPAELSEFVVDQLQEFVRQHNVKIDEHGFVSGDLSPAQVVSLGYQLLAWVVLSNRYELQKIIEQQFHEQTHDGHVHQNIIDIDQIDSMNEGHDHA